MSDLGAAAGTIATMSSESSVFRMASTNRARLRDLREHLEPIYRNRLHTHYTDHSILHCDRVAKRADNLIFGLRPKLNEEEAYVLYQACYLHDIGMHNERAGSTKRLAARLVKDKIEWTNLPREEKLRLIRSHHNEISADMVAASVRSGEPPINFRLEESDFPNEVAAICEGHTLDINSERYRELIDSQDRPSVRLRLISAILRLSDLLDETHHRALVSQAELLELDLEAKTHWWRHYFTREVEINSANSRVTIRFGFPSERAERYTRLIPALQMPELEREFGRHRSLMADHGLNWHVGWLVHPNPYDALSEMPDNVEWEMFKKLTEQIRLNANRTKLDYLSNYDRTRSHLMQKLLWIRELSQGITPDDYMKQILPVVKELWQIGSRLTASSELRNALFHTTTNGRSLAPNLHIAAAMELAEIQVRENDLRDAASTLIHIKVLIQKLPDDSPEKARYYRFMSSVEFSGGSFTDGVEAATESFRLDSSSLAARKLRTQAAEAAMLNGECVPFPS